MTLGNAPELTEYVRTCLSIEPLARSLESTEKYFSGVLDYDGMSTGTPRDCVQAINEDWEFDCGHIASATEDLPILQTCKNSFCMKKRSPSQLSNTLNSQESSQESFRELLGKP